MENSYWVERDRLLAGTYPFGRTLRSLREAGISAFVDLTQPDELAQYDHLLRDTVHRRMAIGDFGVPTDAEMTRTLDVIDALVAEGHRVYVHCFAGVGRTGTVIGCHLIRHGVPNSGGIARLAELRATIGRYDASPEMPAQRALVERWREP